MVRFSLFFIGLVVFVLAAAAVTRAWFFPDSRVKEMLEERLGRMLGSRLRIDTLEIDLFHGVRATGIGMEPPPGFFRPPLAVKKLNASYDIWSLLEKKLVITSIELDGLDVALEHYGENFNLQNVFDFLVSGDEESAPEGRAEGGGVAFEVDSFEVAAATVELHTDKLDAVLGPFDLSGEVALSRGSRRAGIRLELPPSARPIAGLCSLVSWLPALSVAATAGIELENDQLNLDAALKLVPDYVTCPAARKIWPVTDVTVKAVRTGQQFFVDLLARYEGGAIWAKGKNSPPGKGMVFQGGLELSSGLLERFVRPLGAEVAGPGGLQLSVKNMTFSQDSAYPSFSASASISAGRVVAGKSGVREPRLEFRGSFSPGPEPGLDFNANLSAELVRTRLFSAGGLEAESSGRLVLSKGSDAELRDLKVQVSAARAGSATSAVNFRRMVARLNAERVFPKSGRYGPARISATAGELSFDNIAVLRAGVSGSATLDARSGSVDATGAFQAASVDGGPLVLGGVSGRFEGRTHGARFAVASNSSVRSAAIDVGGHALDLRGLKVHVRGTGDGTTARLEPRVELEGVGLISGNLVLKLPAAELSGKASLELDAGRATGLMKTAGLSGSLGSGGRVSADVAGTCSLEPSFGCKGLGGTVHLKGLELSLSGIEAGRADGTLEVELSPAGEIESSGNLRLAALDFPEIARAGGVALQIGLRRTASLASLSVDAKMDEIFFPALSENALRENRFSAEVELLGRKEIALRRLYLSSRSHGISAKGHAQVLKLPAGDFVSGLRFSGSLDAFLDSYAPVTLGPMELTGRANASLDVSCATPRQVRASGSMRFEGLDVRLQAGSTRLDGLRGTLEISQRFSVEKGLKTLAGKAGAGFDEGRSSSLVAGLGQLAGKGLEARRIMVGKIALDYPRALLRWSDGILEAAGMQAGVLGGDVAGSFSVRLVPAGRRTIDLRMEATGLDLARLSKEAAGEDSRLSGNLHLSFDEALRRLDASLNLTHIGRKVLEDLLSQVEGDGQGGASQLRNLLRTYRVNPRSANLQLKRGLMDLAIDFELGPAARTAARMITGFEGHTFRLRSIPVAGLLQKIFDYLR